MLKNRSLIRTLGSALGASLLLAAGVATAGPAAADPPANDDFASAVALDPAGGSRAATGVGATSEPGEPLAPCYGSTTLHATTWYALPVSDAATVWTVATETTADTVVAVYRGTSLADLTRVACNDDEDIFVVSSEVSVAARAGVQYFVQVGFFTSRSDGADYTLTWTDDGRPVNDDFADAIALPEAGGPQSQSGFGATTEPDEPVPSCVGPGHMNDTTWFAVPDAAAAWSAGTFTQGGFGDTVLAVYRGSALGGLTEVACNDDFNGERTSRLSFATDADETYFVQVGFWEVDGGSDYTLTWQNEGPPASNDDFAQAVPLADAGRYDGTGFGATVEEGEPPSQCFGAATDDTVWYQLPAADRTWRLTVEPQYFTGNTLLSVYTGDDLGSLTEVTCNDNTDPVPPPHGHPDLGSRVVVRGSTAAPLYVRVGFFARQPGLSDPQHFVLDVDELAPPANDLFADAQPVAWPASIPTDGTGAAREQDEPKAGCAFGGTTVSSYQTTWFRVEGDGGDLAARIRSERNLDTVLAVYTGASLSDLTEIACNDDLGPNNRRSEVGFPTTAGETYYVQAGFWGDEGFAPVPGAFTLDVGSLPTNDLREDAITIDVPSTTSGTGTFADSDLPRPSCWAGSGAVRDAVWYRLDQAPRTVRVTTSGADTVLAAYRAGDGDALAEVGCNDDRTDDDLGSELALRTVTGPIWLQVGFNGPGSDFEIATERVAHPDPHVGISVVPMPGTRVGFRVDVEAGADPAVVTLDLPRTLAAVDATGAGVTCTAVPLECTVPAGSSQIMVTATPGTEAGHRVTATLSLGAEDDPAGNTASVTTTRSQVCDVLGTTGPDVLRGTRAAEVLCGLAGADVLIGGGGDDVLIGGPDSDAASYSTAGAAMTLDLRRLGAVAFGAVPTLPGTGGSGSDHFIGIENTIGSPYDDVLYGNEQANRLVGGDGDDRLVGGGADDRLTGGLGNDRADGGTGRDVCQGEVLLRC